MPREHKDTFSGFFRREVILQALVAHEFAGRFTRIARHLAELRQQPAQVAIFTLQESILVPFAHFREGNAKILPPYTPQPGQEKKGPPANPGSQGACHFAWEPAEQP